MRTALLFLYLILSSLQWVNAQPLNEKRLQFDHLALEKGLSQATVLSTWQDHHGFIWMGTRDGLNRYDGYSFQVYRHQLGDTHSIAGNIVYEIAGDQKGNMWMITDKGLSKFIRSTSTFKNYYFSSEDAENHEFHTLVIDQSNTIWVGGSQGLSWFDEENEQFKTIASDDLLGANLLSRPVYALYEEKEKSIIWVGTSKDGVYNVSSLRKNLTGVHIHLCGIKSRIEDIVALKGKDQLWIGTYGDGAYLIDISGNILDHLSEEGMPPEKRLTNDNIRTLALDNDENLWVGTFNGLNILTNAGRQVIRIYYEEGNQTGLSHGSIRSIYKDNKGSLWIGTYFGGVSIFDVDNQRFNHFQRIPGKSGALSYNVVGAFSEDRLGDLVIGTERGGLNVFRSKSGVHDVFVHSSGDAHALSGNIIKSLYTGEKHTWVGVFKGGLNKIDLVNGYVKRYPSADEDGFLDLSQAVVNSIVPYDHQKLWIVTDQGLFCFNKKLEKYVNYPSSEALNELLKTHVVKHLAIDLKGRLWLATRGAGVVVFTPETGKIQQYKFLRSLDKSISIEEVNHIYVDQSGQVWISTHGNGVVRLNPSDLAVARFESSHGLSNNIVLGCLQDELNRIWVFTLNGPSRFDPDTQSFKSYLFSSGFPIKEVNEGAFFKTRSGEFIVGGSNGYVRFHPTRLSNNTFVPPVAITRFMLSNKEVHAHDEHSILYNVISESKQITLNHSQSVITFEFAALSFLRSENNQYAYFLEGFDKDWNYIDNKHTVTFTNLPQGKYVLNVKGSNNDGVWNEQVTSLFITVLPPPWKTWWAYVLYGLFFITCILLIRYNALKGIQLKHDFRLEQIEKEKWMEIHKLKLQYFTDVSHEFRTPLTLITGPLEEILEIEKPSKWLKKRLKTMYLNARRLLHLIDQILEIRELETGHANLKLTPMKLETVIGGVVDSFKVLADKKKIQLNYDPVQLQDSYLIDKDKIEKIFFNLLSNSFKFTPVGGKVGLGFTFEKATNDDAFVFEVMDTGKGISENEIDKIFDRFYKQSEDGTGAGIGLSLTRSLVDLLGGDIQVKSEPDVGTSFTIALPFEKVKSVSSVPIIREFVKPLPLEYQPSLLPTHEDPEGLLEEKEILLIVEDNLELRNYLIEHLQKKYHVIEAENGVKALNCARKKGPALIVSDVMMAEMDGMTLCRTVKQDEELCHIPIILLTAKNSSIDRLEGLGHGADDYLGKPFIMKELEARIRNILDNRKRLHKKYKSNYYHSEVKDFAFNSHDEKLIQRVIIVIEQNISESNLTVEYLASEIGLSRVQLFRKLKSLTGMSPAGFIKDFRMKRAVYLLSTKEVKIAEVAYEVGFQDVQYFSRSFKKTYGTSPSQFTQNQEINE